MRGRRGGVPLATGVERRAGVWARARAVLVVVGVAVGVSAGGAALAAPSPSPRPPVGAVSPGPGAGWSPSQPAPAWPPAAPGPVTTPPADGSGASLGSQAAGAVGGAVGGAVSGAVSAALEALCPSTTPPTPQAPDPALPGQGTGGGQYAEYGTAGLVWTSYDVSCINPSRAATGLANGLNENDTSIDDLAGQVMTVALQPHAPMPFDKMLEGAVAQLGASLFTPWLYLGLGVAGLALVGLAMVGRAAEAITLGAVTLGVLGCISWVSGNPAVIPGAADGATSAVMTGVASAEIKATGGGLPAVSDTAAVTETYHLATSYQAWVLGEFCGDARAAAEYGPRFRADQAFTRAEWAKAKDDSGLQTRLVKAKGDAWLADAAGLKGKYPVAFACWSGQGPSRVSAATKHTATTAVTAAITAPSAGAVLVLKAALRLWPVMLVAMGVAVVASRRLQGAFIEILVAGVIGPPMIAAFAATLVVAMSVTMRDPTVAWWQSLVAVTALAVGGWWMRKPLSRAVQGVGAGAGGGTGRWARRRRQQIVQEATGGGFVAGAAAGAAGGAAYAGLDGAPGNRGEFTAFGGGGGDVGQRPAPAGAADGGGPDRVEPRDGDGGGVLTGGVPERGDAGGWTRSGGFTAGAGRDPWTPRDGDPLAPTGHGRHVEHGAAPYGIRGGELAGAGDVTMPDVKAGGPPVVPPAGVRVAGEVPVMTARRPTPAVAVAGGDAGRRPPPPGVAAAAAAGVAEAPRAPKEDRGA